MRNACKILGGKNLKERVHLEDISVEVKIILKWILEKCDVSVWTGLIWLEIETSGGLFQNENELSGSIKVREYLD